MLAWLCTSSYISQIFRNKKAPNWGVEFGQFKFKDLQEMPKRILHYLIHVVILKKIA